MINSHLCWAGCGFKVKLLSTMYGLGSQNDPVESGCPICFRICRQDCKQFFQHITANSLCCQVFPVFFLTHLLCCRFPCSFKPADLKPVYCFETLLPFPDQGDRKKVRGFDRFFEPLAKTHRTSNIAKSPLLSISCKTAITLCAQLRDAVMRAEVTAMRSQLTSRSRFAKAQIRPHRNRAVHSWFFARMPSPTGGRKSAHPSLPDPFHHPKCCRNSDPYRLSYACT